MKMSTIVQIVAVLIVVGFITELFFFGGYTSFINNNRQTITGENITGSTIFNGTIRTYDPFLALPPETSKTILDELKKRPDVTSVSQQGNYIYVRTETRDDVLPIAEYLRSKNVTALSVANIALPPEVELKTQNGVVNASTMGAIVRVETEPLLEADSEIGVAMIGISSEGRLIDYSGAKIQAGRVTINANATIMSMDHTSYNYIIPWADRVAVATMLAGNPGQYTYKYDKKDMVIFSTPLTLTQIMAKRQFLYVVYIDANSAAVSGDFDNQTLLEENFADAAIVLPPSSLDISTNSTNLSLAIPFNSTIRYSYTVKLPNTASGYEVGEQSLEYESDKQLSAGDSLEVRIDAIAIGNKLFSPSLN